MTSFTQAAISRTGGKHVAMIAGPNRIRISPDDTGNRMTVLECTVPSGLGRQDEVCAGEDRLFLVLKGAFSFWSGEQYVELAQGDCIALPGTLPHRFRNIGTSTGTLLVIAKPAPQHAGYTAASAPDAAGETRNTGRLFPITIKANAA
ncbi:cupin domain-containing protein [Rhizobium sp. RU36D]|uniref:cupin domain-containing protein n=1 Tax=Rhizobium sp. RU36D TaxID=1907415 RepID=UPI0009D89A32|nr:cupin domain-containing protein [Rhizobium sp. RU36D]SMD19144.1 Mannose-6-phosphate isomerase, cupin superfamily [Rhizobium sp. RU36D]